MVAARPVSPLNGSYHKVSTCTVAPVLLDPQSCDRRKPEAQVRQRRTPFWCQRNTATEFGNQGVYYTVLYYTLFLQPLKKQIVTQSIYIIATLDDVGTIVTPKRARVFQQYLLSQAQSSLNILKWTTTVLRENAARKNDGEFNFKI